MREHGIPLQWNSKCPTPNADDYRMRAPAAVVPHAALQHIRGTMARAARRPLWTDGPAWPATSAKTETMSNPKPREFFIQGVTPDGQTFRPSDWAERLAGAMSCFRPEGIQGGIGSSIGYSPVCGA